MTTRVKYTGVLTILIIVVAVGIWALVYYSGRTVPDVTNTLSPSMLDMMESMAEQEGISVEEAAYKYGWQNDMALAVDRIREAHPNSVTESAVTGDRSARIDFAGGPPSSAQSEVSEFQALHPGVEVEMRTNRGYSDRDLDNAMEAIHYALLDRDEVENAVTSFDKGTITSRVLISGESSSDTLGMLRELAGEKLTEDKSNMADYINVVVEGMKSVDELGGEE